MSLKTIALISFALVFMLPSLSSAAIMYDWVFTDDDGGGTGPITGTISFNINSGDGGSGLTPSSLIIQSAQGHTYFGPYVLGNEIIGDPGPWNGGYDLGSWFINSNDDITGGSVFLLHQDNADGGVALDLGVGASILASNENGVVAHTAGIASFTLAIPEPSTFCLLSTIVLVCGFRIRSASMYRRCLRCSGIGS